MTIDLTNPLGGNSELTRFEEGASDADIRRRQRAWIIERSSLEESFDNTSCCDSKDCVISKNISFSNCTYIPSIYRSLGISCPDIFEPVYKPNEEAGWPCLLANTPNNLSDIFDISFNGQICNKIIKNPSTLIPSSDFSLSTSDKIALGTGTGGGFLAIAMTAITLWFTSSRFRRLFVHS